MEREFIQMPEFDRGWARLGLGDDDLARLQEEIKKNPRLGAVIPGTGGLRKMRFAFEGRGKSGSARVLYIDIIVAEAVILLGVYAKARKETLSEAEKNDLKALVEKLRDYYRKAGRDFDG